MAEKIKIKTCVFAKEWNGKKIFSIETEDGKIGSTYEESFQDFIGKEIEAEVKEGKEYNGKMQYYFNFPKTGNDKGKQFPKRDYTLEKKMKALELAVRAYGYVQDDVTEENETASNLILKLSDKFLAYLNK